MNTDDSDNALLLESLAWDIPKDLNELSTTRLCLVQWHPLATEEAKMAAELIYWRRRNRAQAAAAAAVARRSAEQEQSNTTEEKVKEEAASSSAPAEASGSSGTVASGNGEAQPTFATSSDKKEASEPIDKPAGPTVTPSVDPVPDVEPAVPPTVNAPAVAQPEKPDEPLPVLAEAPAGEDAAAREVRYAHYQAMLRRQIEHDKQRRQIEADRKLAEQMARGQEMRRPYSAQTARRAREPSSSSSSDDSTHITIARNRPAKPEGATGNVAREMTAREAAEHHARMHRNARIIRRMTALERMEADTAARVAEANRREFAKDGPAAPPQRGPANIAPIMVPRPGASGPPGRPLPAVPMSPERQRVLDEARMRMRALEQPRHLPDAAARRRRFEVLCDSLGNPQTPAAFLEALDRAHTSLQAQRSTGIPDYNYWKNKADYINLLAQERERRNRAFQAGLDALEQERLRRVDDRADLASIADSAEDLESEVLRRRRSMAPTPSSVLDGPQSIVKVERDASRAGSQAGENEEAKPLHHTRANSLDAMSEADRNIRSKAPTPAGGVRFRDQESVIPTPRYNSPETKPIVKPEPKSEGKPQIKDENGDAERQGTSSAPNSPSSSKRKREEDDSYNTNTKREPGTPPPRDEGNDQKKAKVEEESAAVVKLENAQAGDTTMSEAPQSISTRISAQPSTSTSTSTSISSPATNAVNRPSSRSGTPSSSTSEDTSRAKVPAEYVSDLICLYVGNIPSSITADELRTWLLESMPDLPRPAAVCRANRSVGADTYYARVYYSTHADAERVLTALRKRTIGIQGAKPSLAIVKQKMSKLSILWSDLEQWAKDKLAQRMGRAPVATSPVASTSGSGSEQSIRGIARSNGIASRSATSLSSQAPTTTSASSAAAPTSTAATSRSPPASASLASGALEAVSAPQEGLSMADSAVPSSSSSSSGRRPEPFSAVPSTLEARLERPEASHGTPSAAGRSSASLQERLGTLRTTTPNGQAAPAAAASTQSANRPGQSASLATPTAPRTTRQDPTNGQQHTQTPSGSLLSRLGRSPSNTAPTSQPEDTSRNTPKARSNSTDLLSRLG